MKKNIPFKRVIPTCLLFAGALALSACSNDESNKEIPTPGPYRTLTVRASESFGQESGDTRGLAEPQVTRTDLGNGMILEASVVLDDDTNKAATRANQVADDVEVGAIVYNPDNDIIISSQVLTVKKGKLTLEIPQSEVSIIFFSPEDGISSRMNPGETVFHSFSNRTAKDVMWYKTNIPAGATATSLETVTFKHLLTQVCTEITATDGSVVSAFRVYLPDAQADVNLFFPSGKVTAQKDPFDFSMSASGSTSDQLKSDYKIMMPASEETATYTLNITKLMIGSIPFTYKSTNVTATFKLGHRYKIKLNVEKARPYDLGAFYNWDAVTDVNGSDPAHNPKNVLVARESCRYCPDAYDLGYLWASTDPFYWTENGPAWKDKDGTTRYTGLWVLKREYWSETKIAVNQIKPAQGDPSDKSHYIFLPAAGYDGNTSEKTTSADIIKVGTNGRYWLGNSVNIDSGYYIYFSSEYVGRSTLSTDCACCLWTI
ncbi:MAG: fimbrillin family protein [Mediterranea sp.]|jgi:hypothetical protein|nr:fimbrillin family protein [Mediterranea sp.]